MSGAAVRTRVARVISGARIGPPLSLPCVLMTHDPDSAAAGHPYRAPKQNSKALVALLLAVFGWIICPVLAHILALVLANQALDEIRRSDGWLTGEGMANAARIIAIIGLLLTVTLLVLLVVGLIAFVAV